MTTILHHLPVCFCITLLVVSVTAQTTAVPVGQPYAEQVDDEFGGALTGIKPVYRPAEAWGQGDNCTTCVPGFTLNATLASTFHYANYTPGVETAFDLAFNGTQISVFCHRLDSFLIRNGSTGAIIFMDGNHVGQFLGTYDGFGNSSSVNYDTQIYKSDTLKQGPHTLTVQYIANYSYSIYPLLFDYALYSTGAQTSCADSLATIMGLPIVFTIGALTLLSL